MHIIKVRQRGAVIVETEAFRGRFGLVLKPVLAVVLLLSGCRRDGERSAVPDAPGKPIEVQIDFNGRRQNKQFHIDWSPGLTAYSSLEMLQADGKLEIVSRGTGGQTLLTAIDGLENFWAAGDNWVYFVDNRLGDRSSAVFALKPGDHLVWRFGKYEPK